jgi:hypothetical protein
MRGAAWGLAIALLLWLVWLLWPRQQPDPQDQSLQRAVQTLTRQAARWATAARQDANPLIAVLHANYAAGYLWGIADIVSSSQFAQMTGQNYLQFRDAIVAVQDRANRQLAAACPAIAPSNGLLARVAGEAQ